MSVKILNQFPSEDFIAELECMGFRSDLRISREAIEDYYGIESLSDHSNKQKLQENVVAKVLVYISDQESKGRLKEQYQFLTSPVLTQAIGAK